MRSISSRILAGIAVLAGGLGLGALLPLNSAAANPFTWTQGTPVTSPAPRYAHGMAYDSARGVTVLFGGAAVVGGTVINADDTWEWDGSNWTQRTPSLSPAGRREFAMAYDAARQVTVLFGGIDTAGTFRNDTWEWDGMNWIRMTPATSPAGRIDTAMVYDAAIQKVILFGGLDPTQQNVLQADTS